MTMSARMRGYKRWYRLGWSAVSGILMVLSVPRYDLWPLMWIALVPALHVALAAGSGRQAFLQGWWTGTLANTVAFWWMRGLLERFAHMPAYQAIPIMMLLTAYQGLEFAVWSWAVHRIARRCPRVRLAWLAPLVMVAIELTVPQIFPFYLAISQASVVPIIQIADVTGPMGVTFLLVMITGAVYDAARMAVAEWRGGGGGGGGGRGAAQLPAILRNLARTLAVPAAIVAVVLTYGFVRIHQIDARRRAAPHARVGLVQGNVGIQEKWDPAESARLLQLHRSESEALIRRGAQLIVWPESSYPYELPRDLREDYLPGDPRRVASDAPTTTPTPTIFGALTWASRRTEGKDRFPYNTAFMLDETGRISGRYDKIFLLLFGEYIPFYDAIPWFTRLVPEAANFSRGDEVTTFPFRVGGRGREYRLGPLICYEDILAGFSRRVAARDPNLLVNITNDAWFGKTDEPYQHLALSVFRSVEHRLDLVRAVNTGVSAHVDAVGRVLAKADAVDPDAVPPPRAVGLLADAALLERGGVYSAVGDLFAIGCVGALLVIWLGGRGRGRA